jgi:hypothetical protein
LAHFLDLPVERIVAASGVANLVGQLQVLYLRPPSLYARVNVVEGSRQVNIAGASTRRLSSTLLPVVGLEGHVADPAVGAIPL